MVARISMSVYFRMHFPGTAFLKITQLMKLISINRFILKKKLIECNLDSGAGFERDAAVAMFGFEVVRFAIDGHIADATDELLVRLEPTTFLQRTRMSSDVQRVVGVGRRDPSHTHARLHEDIIHR